MKHTLWGACFSAIAFLSFYLIGNTIMGENRPVLVLTLVLPFAILGFFISRLRHVRSSLQVVLDLNDDSEVVLYLRPSDKDNLLERLELKRTCNKSSTGHQLKQ